jgi:hypothetical protein
MAVAVMKPIYRKSKNRATRSVTIAREACTH